MMGSAALLCVASSLPAAAAIALHDGNIRTAVDAWLSNPTAARATYGHISTWATGGVTDMSYLFCDSNSRYSSCYNSGASSFNENIGAWDTSGVTDMEGMFKEATAFNRDIGGWAVHSVRDMRFMFDGASVFDQDLGWCVDDGMRLVRAFYNTPCESTYCGVMWETNTGDCDVPRAGNVMVNWKIRWAINAWLSDATAAEAKYGHISTWETGGVTDMEELFEDEDFSSFNEDIGAWDTSGVTTMRYMFNGASAFDQDLGWCVDDGVSLWDAFSGTQCASPSCGVNNMAALRCGGTMSDTTIRTAVMTWLYDRAAAEATYGHISTWKTGRVTDMAWLFLGKSSFNEDISAWDTSGVTAMQEMFEDAEAFNQDISGWQVGKVKNMAFMFYNAYAFNQPIGGWSIFNQPIGGWSIEAVKIMRSMFEGASAFDQDLGWCVENDVVLNQAFLGTSCYSNACGVGQKDAIGMCEPWARPCLIAGGPSQCIINSPTIIIAIVLILLTGFGAYVHRKKKKDETYVAAARRLFPDSELRAELLYSCLRFCCRKTEPGSVSSRPDSLAKSPSEDSDEEATAPESLETRAAAAAKAKAAETVEHPGFARKLSSFLFGEEQKPTEQLPPPPARRTEPEPAAKFEEMYNLIAAWYSEPENAALRANWGAYPDSEEFQTWPGFVVVTNAFLDREAG